MKFFTFLALSLHTLLTSDKNSNFAYVIDSWYSFLHLVAVSDIEPVSVAVDGP